MTNKIISYCEQHGIYEIYKTKGNTITYYSFFSGEGFYKIVHNLKTGKEIRTLLRYKRIPSFLCGANGSVKYNYCCG